MSDLNIFTLVISFGAAMVAVTAEIIRVCGKACSYIPKMNYLPTSEREMLLKKIYNQTFLRLEDKLKIPCDDKLKANALKNNMSENHKLKALHTLSMFESICSIEPMAFIAENKYHDAFQQSKKNLTILKDSLSSENFQAIDVDKIAAESDFLLRKIANDSNRMLSSIEDNVMMTSLTESMDSLSYKIKANEQTIVGVKDGISIRGKINNGKVLLDTTAFSGLSCHAEVRKIESKLEQQGFIIRRLAGGLNDNWKNHVALKDVFPVMPQAAPVCEVTNTSFNIEDQQKGKFANNIIQHQVIQKHLTKMKVR